MIPTARIPSRWRGSSPTNRGKNSALRTRRHPSCSSCIGPGGTGCSSNPRTRYCARRVEKLREGILPGVQPGTVRPGDRYGEFHRAIHEHHKVRITYARAWEPGIIERVVEPYRLIRTRRGWELDAGPPDENGRIRTFLLNGVQAHAVLDESFDPPLDVQDLVRRHRKQVSVELVMPHDSRWAVDKYAEKVEVVEEYETSAHLRIQLLEPVAQRVGLILLAGGPTAQVAAPAELGDAGHDAGPDPVGTSSGLRQHLKSCVRGSP